jgi:hypothetical protein
MNNLTFKEKLNKIISNGIYGKIAQGIVDRAYKGRYAIKVDSTYKGGLPIIDISDKNDKE